MTDDLSGRKLDWVIGFLRVSAQENRRLTPTELNDLAEALQSGESVRNVINLWNARDKKC